MARSYYYSELLMVLNIPEYPLLTPPHISPPSPNVHGVGWSVTHDRLIWICYHSDRTRDHVTRNVIQSTVALYHVYLRSNNFTYATVDSLPIRFFFFHRFIHFGLLASFKKYQKKPERGIFFRFKVKGEKIISKSEKKLELLPFNKNGGGRKGGGARRADV